MRLIDDSPGLFITICFVVLYGTVAVEAGMLVANSIALMIVTFAGILAVAAALCAWMFRLLDDGATVIEPAPAEQPAVTVPAPVAVPEPVVAVRTQPAARALVHA